MSKPLKPVPKVGSGRGVALVKRYSEKVPPDWAYWPPHRPVWAWQAAALSLGLDPDSLEEWPGWMLEFDEVMQTKKSNFPDAETALEHRKRYDFLEALTGAFVKIPLGEAAAMLAHLPCPDEFRAMAGKAPTVKVGAGATADESPQERKQRLKKRADELKRNRVRAWQKKIAEEEGVSTQRIRALLKNEKTKTTEKTPDWVRAHSRKSS